MISFLSTYLYLFKNLNHKIIFLFILLSFSCEYTIQPVDNKYPRIKELPSGEFFIIMSNGLYISNNDFSNITKIYEFNYKQSILNDIENNKTALTEFRINKSKLSLISGTNN